MLLRKKKKKKERNLRDQHCKTERYFRGLKESFA
jgi:hypothetical protein